MNDFLLVFDQGSSASKAFLFDSEGRIVGQARRALNATSPASGYWEHDAAEIWSGQQEAAMEVLERLPAGGRIVGLGITNQRSTIMAWDAETSQPLYNALSWQDMRGAPYIDDMSGEGPRIQDLTGLKLTPYYSVSKLKWLIDNVDEVQEAKEQGRLRWGTVNSWLIWNLTKGKVWATDHSNAARTLMFRLETLQWERELQRIFDLTDIEFPEVYPTCHYFGNAELKGMEIPIYASVGDQQAALVGQGANRPGDTLINFGTLGAVLVMIGEKAIPREGLLLSIAFSDDDRPNYLLEGTINSAGNLLNWMRENMGLIHEGEDLDELCNGSGERILFFPGLMGLAAPHWRHDVCSNFLGLSRASNRADMVRAAVESIGFSVAEVFQELDRRPGVPITKVSLGGGLEYIRYLRQFTANLIQRPLYQFEQAEVTARGAAFLAGLQAGVWRDMEEVGRLCRHESVETPSMPAAEVRELMKTWKESMEVALKWRRIMEAKNV